MQITALPSPLNTIVIENQKGTYKDFHASSDYPLRGVTYPVDYGYLPGYTGEDKADLDFFVGNEEAGVSGFIRVSRSDTENGETKFFIAVTKADVEAICEAFKPVLLEYKVFSNSSELLGAIKTFETASEVKTYEVRLKTKSGKSLHPIGVGTWNISGVFELDPAAKYKGTRAIYGNEEAEIEALRYSINKGQNHIDCAELYGAFYTDEVVGRAIAGFNREDLFIADKLWKTSVAKGQVRPIVEQMLQKLDTDYLDLLYIHDTWPDWQEAVPQIDELIDEGIVRHFGVSNFNIEQMQEAQVIARHPIAANQMKYNVLYKDQVTSTFLEFCKAHDVQIVAYQPIKRQEVLTDKTVKTIAATHNVTPAQVALAWLIQKGTLPIPKSTNKAHIAENLRAIEIKLSDEDMAKLEAI